MLIAKIVVFDDDPAQLRERLELADQALATLLRERVLQLDSDEPLAAVGRRHEAQEMIEDALRERPGHGVLLLSDIQGRARRGNIGARLVRAMAQHPLVAERSVRVAWTTHAVADVTAGLRPWVHATVAYRPDGSGDLIDAVRYAVADGAQHGPREFPAARPMEDWADDVLAKIESLLDDPDAVEVGDDVIALGIYAKLPDKEINQRVAGGRRGQQAVQSFVAAVKEAHRCDNMPAARELIEEEIAPVAEDRVGEEIIPDVVRLAIECLDDDLRDRSDEERAAAAWLTPGEFDVTRRFVALYRKEANTLGLSADAYVARQAIINGLIGGRTGEPQPELAQALARNDLTVEDVAYGLWSLKDLRQGA